MVQWSRLAAALLMLGLPACSFGLRADDPAALARTTSIGQLIAAPGDETVHIVYVHGMRTEGPGFSQPFLAGMCRHVGSVICPPGGLPPTAERHQILLGSWPRQAKVMGATIWRAGKDWTAGQPFIDRYRFPSRVPGGHDVVVDEVNWWPLLFALKCQFIVAGDSQLSGLDQADLNACENDIAPYHDWLTTDAAAQAAKGAFVSGGGVWLNSQVVKQPIMDFGLADAVIALGPMRRYLRRTIDQAFAYAMQDDPATQRPSNYVIISESLGSFVVLDAVAQSTDDTPNAKALFERTGYLYFFANQFALLELGRITGLSGPEPAGAQADVPVARPANRPGRRLAPAAPAVPVTVPATGAAPADPQPSPFAALRDWSLHEKPAVTALEARLPPPKQVIAFNDPADILTFDMPKLPPAIVVNIYDHNETYWFGAVVDPTRAHTGHSGNEAVLQQMLGTP